MDTQIIKMKLNAFTLADEPFIELDRCFEPCVTHLKQKTIDDYERTCYTNCISKYLRVTHDFKLSIPMLSKNLQHANAMRETVEKESIIAESKVAKN